MTVTEPSWVPEQRAHKAATLADALRALGATAYDVTEFTPKDRREAERAAAVRKASDQTWRIVTDMLAGSAAPDALCPTCKIGDPEGVDGPPQPYGHAGLCSR